MGLGQLVPDRLCGACTVCCTVPGIDTPAAQRKPNTRCRHCLDHSCAIYDQRPSACVEFYCAWRRLDMFDDAWRPDRFGLFVTIDPVEPDNQASAHGFTLMFIADPFATLRASALCDFVIAQALRRVPLFVALPGPPGCLPARTALPEGALQAAVWEGPARVVWLLEQAVHFLRATPPRPAQMVYGGNDLSA